MQSHIPARPGLHLSRKRQKKRHRSRPLGFPAAPNGTPVLTYGGKSTHLSILTYICGTIGNCTDYENSCRPGHTFPQGRIRAFCRGGLPRRQVHFAGRCTRCRCPHRAHPHTLQCGTARRYIGRLHRHCDYRHGPYRPRLLPLARHRRSQCRRLQRPRRASVGRSRVGQMARHEGPQAVGPAHRRGRSGPCRKPRKQLCRGMGFQGPLLRPSA